VFRIYSRRHTRTPSSSTEFDDHSSADGLTYLSTCFVQRDVTGSFQRCAKYSIPWVYAMKLHIPVVYLRCIERKMGCEGFYQAPEYDITVRACLYTHERSNAKSLMSVMIPGETVNLGWFVNRDSRPLVTLPNCFCNYCWEKLVAASCILPFWFSFTSSNGDHSRESPLKTAYGKHKSIA
jgi:hypothetical protein